MTLQQQIKQVLVDLASDDKLTLDFNELDPSVFDKVVEPYVTLIENLREDAEMALDGRWNKSNDGFEAQIQLIDKLLNY